MSARSFVEVTPSAARLTGSLRDIGYDFSSAVADLVDNSIAAKATRVEIDIEFEGADSMVIISDDGHGMTASGVNEALRFGSRRDYEKGDLGRYGLGLKTASLSQCRAITVASRRPNSNRTSVRQLDLDLIEEWDRWFIAEPGRTYAAQRAREILDGGMSTVVVWEALDRVLPEQNVEGGWARRRIESARSRLVEHLSMVFHRFLDPSSDSRKVDIVVNGEKLEAWDPYATTESGTTELPVQQFELSVGDITGAVTLRRFVLPPRDGFSTPAEFERYGGPLKWNRQQGLYFYRADRLVQWGGWAGVRAIDEHTKLARAALEFGTELDPVFNINVAKMRLSVPPQLRQMLERPINELCSEADARYRKTPRPDRSARRPNDAGNASVSERRSTGNAAAAAVALRAAALQTGEYEALRRIASAVRENTPELAEWLGLDTL